MHVLIVKLSSLGDVIHSLPALTDAIGHYPGLSFDWVVEPAFAEIASWHQSVVKTIPCPLRRWRQNPYSCFKNGELRSFVRNLRQKPYDLIIDLQGLLKSAVITAIAKGPAAGYHAQSAREPLATLFYRKKAKVELEQHAIQRNRLLMSQLLNYPMPTDPPRYGLLQNFPRFESHLPYLVFLHATTWISKHWPESYWIRLGKIAARQGWLIKLPWGNILERERALRIQQNLGEICEVLPKLSLKELAGVLQGAKAVVAVDTGLAHLATALEVPTLALYGPTSPKRSGTWGEHQRSLSADFSCAPCFKRDCHYQGPVLEETPACFTKLSPEQVCQQLLQLIPA